MRTIKIVFVAVMSVLFGGTSSQADDWQWIRIIPNDQTGWSVERGTSTMTLRANHFSISLTKDHLSGSDVVLSGSIDGNDIRAREIQQGTDAAPITFRGKIAKTRTPLTSAAQGWGSDRIWLSTPGGFYVGLFRTVQEPPK